MLNIYEKLNVIRPNPTNHLLDSYDMPIIKSISQSDLDLNNAEALNITNLKCCKKNSNKIIMPFVYDKILNRYWNEPLKYIPLFQTVMAVGTPDYSVYKSMNVNEIRHNIYKNRWLGCLWQEYGCKVIPTIAWSDESTYDICFSGLENNSVVMISTVGCLKHQKEFLEGFNEMRRRIDPSLIIVYGRLINGMAGDFINFDYEDGFNKKEHKSEIIKLFDVNPVFKLKEVM